MKKGGIDTDERTVQENKGKIIISALVAFLVFDLAVTAGTTLVSMHWKPSLATAFTTDKLKGEVLFWSEQILSEQIP